MKIRIATLLATMCLTTPVMAKPPTTPNLVYTQSPAGRPFSAAVQVGDILYMSGQLGTDAQGELVSGFDAQARQAMDNIMDVAKSAGAGADDVFKCTVMMSDMKNWGAFNQVYVKYFRPDHLPARSAFGVSGLALGGDLEVECSARVPMKHGV